MFVCLYGIVFFIFCKYICLCVVVCVFFCDLLKLHNICIDVYGDLETIDLIAHVSGIFTIVLLFALLVTAKVRTVVFRMVVSVEHLIKLGLSNKLIISIRSAHVAIIFCYLSRVKRLQYLPSCYTFPRLDCLGWNIPPSLRLP